MTGKNSQSISLGEALKEIDRVLANLELLKGLWSELQEILAHPAEGHWDQEEKEIYETKWTEFAVVLRSLPAIRGVTISNCLPDYDWVSEGGRTSKDIGDPDIMMSFHSQTYAQGTEIRKYEAALERERRRLVRAQAQREMKEVGRLIAGVSPKYSDVPSEQAVDLDDLKPLRDAVQRLNVLLGKDAWRPTRWGDLLRHLAFGQVCDLRDIEEHDWPAVAPDLERYLYARDPIPVKTEDVGDLVDGSQKLGDIGTELDWTALDAVQFERLCADLLQSLPNWENVSWLTPTRAPDRGRDLEALWVTKDPSRGLIKQRALIQCKHRPGSSVGPKDVERLQNLLLTYGGVDLYLIVTSGKFSDQATQIVESWNSGSSRPKVELWEHWKLEQLLAARPDLVVFYNLR